jgi:hypothetical protein
MYTRIMNLLGSVENTKKHGPVGHVGQNRQKNDTLGAISGPIAGPGMVQWP